MEEDLEIGMPEMYEIYHLVRMKNFFRLGVVAWWIILAYMVVMSRKDDELAYILSYGFLVLGTLSAFYVFCKLDERFTVYRGIITRHPAFSAQKSYCIEDITKVVVHRSRASREFRIYIGTKKIFEVDTMMWNYNLFLETLQKRGIPFQ